MRDLCAICNEDFIPETKGDGKAEMFDPDTMRAIESGEITEEDRPTSVTCHFACGSAKGYTLV